MTANGRTGKVLKPYMIRQAWIERFGLKACNRPRDVNDDLMRQLSQCKTDECRRLILGVK